MIRGLFLPGVLAVALAAAGPARAERFALDPVHTRVAFQVSHAGFSSPVGTFAQVSGALDFDPDWSTARVEVRIPISTLQLGDTQWQGKILDGTFFDAKKFPEAHFVSTKVDHAPGSAEAEVTGDLTLHGVTRPVTLHVKFNKLARHPLTFKRTAGFSATATLSRKAFGMDRWEKVVGDEVRLILEVEATKDKDAGDGH